MNKPTTDALIQMRSGQKRLFDLVESYRTLAFLARRQYGKTTTFANIAIKKMMKRKNHTVIFGSAKLNLSREIILKEANVLNQGLAHMRQVLSDGTLDLFDATGKKISGVNSDDFADLFEHSRLELRYYHDRTSYSRTKVVALRADTVGETGDLMADEIGRINNWREVYEAIEPIIMSNPEYRLLLSTTIPPDDSHYSYSQLLPPPGMTFEVNPDGNVYQSQMGLTVLRLDAYDAFDDGVPLYSAKDGQAVDPATHRAMAPDKDAWDRNYGCIFLVGGSAAVSLLSLNQAQQRGAAEGCTFYDLESDAVIPADIAKHFKPNGLIAIGADPATTERDKSNPFGICIMQATPAGQAARVIISTKTASPTKAKALLVDAVELLKQAGHTVVSVAIDATSERFWCAEVADLLVDKVDVQLINNSSRTEYMGEDMTMKQYLASVAVAALSDNSTAIPPAREIVEDFRLVKRTKGTFDNDLAPNGRHGDLFDAFKNALFALHNDNEFAVEAVAQGIKLRRPNLDLALQNEQDDSHIPDNTIIL